MHEIRKIHEKYDEFLKNIKIHRGLKINPRPFATPRHGHGYGEQFSCAQIKIFELGHTQHTA
jgi:hypothetical protein